MEFNNSVNDKTIAPNDTLKAKPLYFEETIVLD